MGNASTKRIGGRRRKAARKSPACDPEATREALLSAGRSEFARHGFAGARTDRIARAARVNRACCRPRDSDQGAWSDQKNVDALSKLSMKMYEFTSRATAKS